MRHLLFFCFTSLVFALSCMAADDAVDWHQWRGPNRDDISTETGLLKQWPASGPSIVWKATGLGGGFSSVSIAGGRIYTMGDLADGCSLVALNLADGKVLWTAKVGSPAGGGGYPGPRCTPAVDGDIVVALGQFGDLVCVESASGKEIWHKNMHKDFAGMMMSGWGYSESPLIDGDKVICTPGGPSGTIVALNKKTGDVLWRTKDYTDKAAYSSLVPVEIGGVRQYLQLTDASVVGIEAKDGKLLWQAARPGKTAVIPTPIYADNMVFVASGYGIGQNLFKIDSTGGQFRAEQVYAGKELANHHGGVLMLNGYIYGTTNALVCMELKTGKIMWSNPSVGKGSLTCADGYLYVRSENGPVALVEATPKGYHEAGRFDQPERTAAKSWAHPVVAGGKLYLRDQDKLFCYDVKGK